MTVGQKTIILGGLLVFGLGLPQASFGISGACTLRERVSGAVASG